MHVGMTPIWYIGAVDYPQEEMQEEQEDICTIKEWRELQVKMSNV